MEEGEDFSLCGKAAVTETNLRDDIFWKIVADFLGPQTGVGLELDKEPCKNRFLIQVGLMREENNLPWTAVINWLQRIFPERQSTDFRCLIERGIATTLSLGSDARLNFLESDVNFNFVGPICDSIGVEREHLLEMRDFSERAKSIEVTNGLVLELSKFVTREKIDPVHLVTWLRNFNPKFCKDGYIQKANQFLRSKIKKLKLCYRNHETRSHRRNAAMENLLQSPFELVPKRAERKIGMKKQMKKDAVQNYRKVKIKEEYDSYESMQDEEKPFPHHDSESRIKDEYDSSEDGGDMEQFSRDKTPDYKGEALTLLDIAMLSVQKLTSVYGGKTDASKQVSMDLLKNQYTLTCKEHPAMLQFETEIESLAADISLASPLVFLHRNAHFLVDIHDAVEQQMMSFEREITQTTGQKLGRDKNPKFAYFVNFSESATSRYIHMACDVLSPRAPSKQNYRKHWVAFCEEKKNPSRLAVNLSNRFTNYFEAAAGLIHHHKEIALFFSDLLLMDNDDCPNVILESVTADATDDVIQSLVCAVAIIYCKILGPYWQLLKSGGEYLLFSQYILCLYQKLLEWCKNPSTLLEPEVVANVFLQFPLQEKTFDRIFQYCGQWHTNRDLIRACLKKMVKVIAAVIEENLMDFLPGGKYSQRPPEEVSSQVASCTFSVLMGEYPFGHAYPYKRKRPDKASRHTSSNYSSSDSSQEDNDMSSSSEDGSEGSPRRSAHKNTSPSRKGDHSHPSKRANSLHKSNNKDKVGGNVWKHQNETEHFEENMDREYIVRTVIKHGGPCKTQQDVDKLLLRFDGKPRAVTREALRCEILYQKMVLDNNDLNLENVGTTKSVMAYKLKLSLPRVKPGYSVVLAPKRTQAKYIPAQPTEAQSGQSESSTV
ncbi:uncharacterized protein LOC115367950 isoform X2 [Myripristis murdjan]|nr:uncharacterized protein LOC115367950 isoform X2 [Myripristis murdjan]